MTEGDLRISLRHYLERRLDDLDARYNLRFETAERAVSKAEATINARLEGMNEFRAALKDQASRLATREDLRRIEEEVNDLRRAGARLDGRIATFVAVVSAAVSVLTAVFARWLLP